MPVNHEFDLLEVKVNELGSVVDVFVVLESNVTAAGKMEMWIWREGCLYHKHQHSEKHTGFRLLVVKNNFSQNEAHWWTQCDTNTIQSIADGTWRWSGIGQ